jgi:hypothetical protein
MSNILLRNSNFIHIPKCGGTFINTLLWRLGCVENHSCQYGSPSYGHLFASQMPANGKPSFTFVRHPVSWWLSYYHWNKNEKHSRFSEEEKQAASFDAWVNDYGQFWLGLYTNLVKRYMGIDPLFPSNTVVEYVGKTENLIPDLLNILDVLKEECRPEVIAAIKDNRLQYLPAHINKQEYDRDCVSKNSHDIICAAESHVCNKFNYE